MAPSYERPPRVVPSGWPAGEAYESASAATPTLSAAALPWQDFVHDANLRHIIERALLNNRDLHRAVATLESASAQYRIERSALFPVLNAGVAASRARAMAPGSGSNTTVVSGTSSATVGMSAFELDLFGKVKSLSDAALESYLSTEEALRATQVSLIAETAVAYVTLAADRSRLLEAMRTVESAERSVQLTSKRLQVGVASRIDVRQAETIYQQARADVAGYTTSVAQDRNALELLAGGPIGEAWLPASVEDQAGLFAEVGAGTSSDVLLQRPDVLQAERDLRAANANIGAARAAFFPSISLTANGGVGSKSLSDLFSRGAAIWSFAPSVSLPIFDGGANKANLAYSTAQRSLFLSTYEKSVQTAFKEVSDALARRGTMQEQLEAQRAQVAAAEDNYRLALARYQSGVDSYLNALDAQRTVYGGRQSLLSVQAMALENRITLYRVMGGGADASGGSVQIR